MTIVGTAWLILALLTEDGLSFYIFLLRSLGNFSLSSGVVDLAFLLRAILLGACSSSTIHCLSWRFFFNLLQIVVILHNSALLFEHFSSCFVCVNLCLILILEWRNICLLFFLCRAISHSEASVAMIQN